MRISRAVLSALLILVAAVSVGAAQAGAAEGESTMSWGLEGVLPPETPEAPPATTPIGLGPIGDIEFWAPNRGLLITAGNPPTVPAGLWAYDGRSWHELSNVCGATNGRIVWVGPDEFWTISDGRAGQAVNETGRLPPLADNTLCHFVGGHVVGSYASLAFQASSYQAMTAGACFGPEDCWFGGEPLPPPQAGAFQLHWDGHGLTAEPHPQGHAVADMRLFESALYQSVDIRPTYNPRRPGLEDRLTEEEDPAEPSDLHLINPAGITPTFFSLTSPGVPVYAGGEPPWALEAMHLGGNESSLWGAANPLPRSQFPRESSAPYGEVTVVRDVGGSWTQVIGPSAGGPEGNPFTRFTASRENPTSEELDRESSNEYVTSIAAEPGSEDAVVALSSAANDLLGPRAVATVARLSPTGAVSELQTLPSAAERSTGVGPKGAAQKVVCPAVNDCWVTTTQGWLFHTTGGGALARDTDPAFATLITERPIDAGIPQAIADAPPEDDAGLLGEAPPPAVIKPPAPPVVKVTVPLLSSVRTRLVRGTTLELRFHLAVKARVRLLADRHNTVVASTPARVMRAGTHSLLLRLNARNWPTRLDFRTRALAPLPTHTVHEAGGNTIGTEERFLTHGPFLTGSRP